MNHNKINESGYNEAPKFGPSDNNPSMYMFDKKYDLKGEEFIKPISSTYSIKNKIMNQIDIDYQNLVRDILENGHKKNDRTGTGTISVFGRTIRHSMKDGFPLLTTKKMAWKTMVTELLWFLRGDTNIKYLVDNNSNIWTGDAYRRYKTTPIDDIKVEHKFKLPNFVSGEVLYKPNDYVHYTQQEFINKIKTDDEFAKKFGDLGPVYGKQWRSWTKFETVQKWAWYPETAFIRESKPIDQIANVINLLKTDPDSRRMIVNAYNIGQLDQMVLPPCHMMFQFYTRELNEKEGIKKQGLVVKYKGNDCKIKDYSNANHELLILDTPEGDRVIYENQLDKPIDYSKFPTRAISLRWDQRSCDIALGIPMNISSYALLLMMIAKQVNMVPEDLIGDLGDCHIYNDHIEGMREQLTRTPYELPTVEISDKVVEDLSEYTVEDFKLKNYVSHPKIYFPLSN